MPYLRATLLVLFMAVTLLIVAPLQAVARQRGWAMQDMIQKGFCRVVCAILGIDVIATGVLPAHRPAFVVANHLSWTDIVALASVHPFVFLAKKEVSAWPALGFLSRLQGTVFVKRSSRREIPAVNAALADVLREGRDVVVFAEGTSTDGTSPPRFRAGHFDAAREAASVAPVALFYSDGHAPIDHAPIDIGWYGDMTFLPHLWRLMRRGSARCHIIFGEAIDPRGKDRKALAAEAEARVSALLHLARRGGVSDAPRQ